MTDYTLYYWPMPFRGQFIRAILAYAEKTWDEPDDIESLMEQAPDTQPVPFMGPPVLIDQKTGFTLSEMPAIAFYLGKTLDLLPRSIEEQAMTIKIVNDANDVIDEITCDGGRTMWTPENWKAFVPRLRRWMDIFEAIGQRNGMTAEAGYMLGGDAPTIADIVTATLWGTLADRFPKMGEILKMQAPLTSGLTGRLMATKSFTRLMAYTNKHFGDSYCGGQIEASLRKVITG